MSAIIHTPSHLSLQHNTEDHPKFQNSPSPQIPRYLIWFLSSHHNHNHYLTIFIKSPFNLIYSYLYTTQVAANNNSSTPKTWVTWATTKLALALAVARHHQGAAEGLDWTPESFMFSGYARGSTSSLGSLIVGSFHMVRLFNCWRKWFAEKVASKETTATTAPEVL